ncbi:hypothetical protein L0F63_007085, partial [Massospora cicadina]
PQAGSCYSGHSSGVTVEVYPQHHIALIFGKTEQAVSGCMEEEGELVLAGTPKGQELEGGQGARWASKSRKKRI